MTIHENLKKVKQSMHFIKILTFNETIQQNNNVTSPHLQKLFRFNKAQNDFQNGDEC